MPSAANDVDVFLDQLFQLVQLRLQVDELAPVVVPDLEFTEGRRVERLHIARERNASLVETAKALMRARQGRLFCQVCQFDFETAYGAYGSGYIEAHHTIPVSLMDADASTRVEDIALVCANCHRILHRRRPWLGMKELSRLLAKRATP